MKKKNEKTEIQATDSHRAILCYNIFNMFRQVLYGHFGKKKEMAFMRAYERFLRYAAVYTTSDPDSGLHPSTSRQLDLARILETEMRQVGLQDVYLDAYGYVYGKLDASAGCEQLPALGFIAHMDTADDASGENVKPQLHPDYDGGPVLLPGSGQVLDPCVYRDLQKCKGEMLITTDGTTLLGADDKAGIAEILTAIQTIQEKSLPHPRLCVAFTPDEEIGEGALLFDLERFGADFAYTVDGGDVGEVECENFNAAAATVSFRGISVHPGTAKNLMVNAQNLAMEFHGMLPADQRPEHTEGREGFFHLCSMVGTVSSAKLGYIIRDHDRETFEKRKALMKNAAEFLNQKYDGEYVHLEISDTYFNMLEIIQNHWHLMEHACEAVRLAGLEPKILPVRGGTDGAALSFKGLPCPNLGTGGFNFHGESEFITAERMDRAVEVLLQLAQLYSRPI
ncbi:MAG: peptidase T [Bacteroidales bacterium]|nr:peptidase T [Bacteroidales bacterium]